MLRKSFAIGVLVILSLDPVMSQRVRRPAALPSAISEDALRAHIKFLSDDRLEGRGTGSRGGETAALYIAEQFEALGLKGAGAKGSFWQPVSLVGVKADPKTELRISGQSGTESFKFADDFVAFCSVKRRQVIALRKRIAVESSLGPGDLRNGLIVVVQLLIFVHAGVVL